MAAPSDGLPLDPPQDNQESGEAGRGSRDHGHVPVAQVNSYCHGDGTLYTLTYLICLKVTIVTLLCTFIQFHW